MKTNAEIRISLYGRAEGLLIRAQECDRLVEQQTAAIEKAQLEATACRQDAESLQMAADKLRD